MSVWTRVAAAAAVSVAVVLGAFFMTTTSSAQGVQTVALASAQPVAEPAPEAAPPAAPATSAVAPEPPTVAPAPVPSPPPSAAVVAREPDPLPEPEPAPEPARPAPGAAERCASARQWVAGQGLVLPAGFAFRCPDPAIFADGASRWGITCWNCGAPGGSYIAINIDRIGPSDDTLRYVVAHETCHAIQDVTTGVTSEESADACAAAHGAPPP